jgi:hypothetical protein
VRTHSPFSSLTEIDNQPSSRDDKRYTEKKNKTERARRKKEDIARLRGIVDVCLSVDSRIKRIKQEEKEAREAKKKGKAGTPQSQKAKEDEEKKKAEEEAKRKVEEEKVREIRILLFQPASRRRRLLGSKRRKIKWRPPTRQRRLAGQHEPQQSSKPLHNVRWSSPSNHHTTLAGLYIMVRNGHGIMFPTVCF